MKPKISLIASAIRIYHWMDMYNSLRGNTYPFEVIFVGDTPPNFNLPKNFKYIHSKVKPAQCYEIGFRAAEGELIGWTTDDSTYDHLQTNNLDIAYDFFKSFKTEKLVVAMRPIEDSGDIWNNHYFFGKKRWTPYMAPFGIMSRKLLMELGGYDRQFICGQAENDIVMRVYELGGDCKICMDSYVAVHHVAVHKGARGHFRQWYPLDRQRLENCWVEEGYGAFQKGGRYTVSKKRLKPFEPFPERNILTVSAEPRGQWV